uniref:Nuclear receptor NHR-107 n=1 Tax=Caenorhabditis elegans TaxID=6239 RepID=Q86PJ3_CAEEL|nr:nuclear receptor NHR-107 [Caenorhabditis elegans]
MVNCMVCDASSAQYHFGAIACRACAAFFRRYVNSKKLTILCKCLSKKESQCPCRLCRMKKCKAVGMEASKVQGPRDVNNPFKIKMIEGSSSPESTLSSIEYGLQPRDSELIKLIIKNYKNLEMTREAIYNMTPSTTGTMQVNLYELSLEVKTDSKLMWKLCEDTFPEFNQLCKMDKRILFNNFYSKWSILEVTMLATKYNDSKNFYSPSGAMCTSINEFYVNTVRDNSAISQEDIIRVFEPYWKYHFEQVIDPFLALKLNDMENMALFGIIFWDGSYTNISDELSELCHSMRKIICRELSAHFNETCTTSSRFFETLDTLNIIEKAERKCQEEIALCGFYNFEVDDDMKNMIMWEKY